MRGSFLANRTNDNVFLSSVFRMAEDSVIYIARETEKLVH